MLMLNFNGKPYMRSPMAPSHFVALKDQSQGYSDIKQ